MSLCILGDTRGPLESGPHPTFSRCDVYAPQPYCPQTGHGLLALNALPPTSPPGKVLLTLKKIFFFILAAPHGLWALSPTLGIEPGLQQ